MRYEEESGSWCGLGLFRFGGAVYPPQRITPFASSHHRVSRDSAGVSPHPAGIGFDFRGKAGMATENSKVEHSASHRLLSPG